MSDAQTEWASFHNAALKRPPRELLRRTVGFFEIEKRPPGVAVDLGCGSGPDTMELLRRGWQVHAIDASANGLKLLTACVPAELKARLQIHESRFEDFKIPKCDLIWAGYSLPFCDPDEWPSFWTRALAALSPNGRVAGDLFGTEHGFAVDGVMVFSERNARALFSTLEVEAFDVEDGYRPSGKEITRWHAFGFAARKLNATDMD